MPVSFPGKQDCSLVVEVTFLSKRHILSEEDKEPAGLAVCKLTKRFIITVIASFKLSKMETSAYNYF